MTWLLPLAEDQFLPFTLVLVRLSGLVLWAPVLGTPDVPGRMRVYLILAMALVIAPLGVGRAGEMPDTLLGYAWVAVGELAVGVLLGLGLQALFAALQLAGQLVDQQAGLALGEIFNPQLDADVSVTGQLYYFLGMAVFLIVGGHRMAIAALLETFAVVPVGTVSGSPEVLPLLIALSGQVFSLAVRVAAPAVLALMLAGLALGYLARTVPQLNILVIGFPIRAFFGMVAVAASLAGVAVVTEQSLGETFDMLAAMLRVDS